VTGPCSPSCERSWGFPAVALLRDGSLYLAAFTRGVEVELQARGRTADTPRGVQRPAGAGVELAAIAVHHQEEELGSKFDHS
jgi:hypothetical protein